MPRVLIVGNQGSGKTSLARGALVGEQYVPDMQQKVNDMTVQVDGSWEAEHYFNDKTQRNHLTSCVICCDVTKLDDLEFVRNKLREFCNLVDSKNIMLVATKADMEPKAIDVETLELLAKVNGIGFKVSSVQQQGHLPIEHIVSHFQNSVIVNEKISPIHDQREALAQFLNEQAQSLKDQSKARHIQAFQPLSKKFKVANELEKIAQDLRRGENFDSLVKRFNDYLPTVGKLDKVEPAIHNTLQTTNKTFSKYKEAIEKIKAENPYCDDDEHKNTNSYR